MSVQFEEENKYDSLINNGSFKPSKMISWLIRKGVAKDEKSAQKILLVISLICFSLAIIIAIIT